MTRLKTTLTICILDPLHEGSHAHWAKGVKHMWEQQGHRVHLKTMPGRHWKWRMHGAATTWALEIRQECQRDMHLEERAQHGVDVPDVIVTTDMCDTAQLRGLLPSAWSHATFIVYFHENQLTFPWSPTDDDPNNGRSHTYGYINITSALAADAVWFNSQHHREVFLSAVEEFVQTLPKPRPRNVQQLIVAKSCVLPIGFNSPIHDALGGASREVTASDWPSSFQRPSSSNVPVILWNHRWSDDKGTRAFAEFAQHVVSEDIPAQFAILGRAPERLPDGWHQLKDILGSRCVHWGFVEDEDMYRAWLERADIAPIQPRQEYFGISILEAMASGTIPWVPESHAYVETMPSGHRYLPSTEWVPALKERAHEHWPLTADDYRKHALTFLWNALAPRYDEALLRARKNRQPERLAL